MSELEATKLMEADDQDDELEAEVQKEIEALPSYWSRVVEMTDNKGWFIIVFLLTAAWGPINAYVQLISTEMTMLFVVPPSVLGAVRKDYPYEWNAQVPIATKTL